MYTPNYLEVLDRSRTVDGWPEVVSDEAKDVLKEVVLEILNRDVHWPLDRIVSTVFREQKVKDVLGPIGTYDLRYAIVYRALLAVGAEQVSVIDEQ